MIPSAADSAKELAWICGVSVDAIYSCISRRKKGEWDGSYLKVKVEDDYLSKLLLLAEAIDPDASFSEKHARSDYGQKAVYYWTEDGNRIRCCERGDIDYILDDPDSELFEQMWDEIAGYFEPIS